ncbi:MAG: hypothetical protein TYPL_3050 [Candidatus Tyloplasma litorale]|nr:MAG: hypothetical protein TYPL_3050 [Mycoplasmatales bacterium]
MLTRIIEFEERNKDNIKNIINKLIKQYEILNEISLNKNYEKVSKIIANHDLVKENCDSAFEDTVQVFSFSPLGIDLRRNISYTMIVKILSTISKNCKETAKFISNSYDLKPSLSWLNEFCEKIIKRFNDLENVITTENPEWASRLIKKDISINELYKRELKSFAQKILSTKEKLNKDQLMQDVILAIKSLELTLAGIKEISEMTFYITTGKIFGD